MLIGSARTSTLEQQASLEAQKRELVALGVERLFTEQTYSPGPRRALGRRSALPERVTPSWSPSSIGLLVQ
jgi:hypothetical protein